MMKNKKKKKKTTKKKVYLEFYIRAFNAHETMVC